MPTLVEQGQSPDAPDGKAPRHLAEGQLPNFKQLTFELSSLINRIVKDQSPSRRNFLQKIPEGGHNHIPDDIKVPKWV